MFLYIPTFECECMWGFVDTVWKPSGNSNVSPFMLENWVGSNMWNNKVARNNFTFCFLSFCVAWLSIMNIYYFGSCSGTKFNVSQFQSLHSQQNISRFFVLFAFLPLSPSERILAAWSPGSWPWKEKAVLGLQAARGCGWRGVELSTQVPASPRMGRHSPSTARES